MKLIDILVEELPKRDGWPVGVCEISTHASGRVFFDGRFAPRGFSLPMASDAWNKYKHPRSYTNAVKRDQYEAALAASKRRDHKWIPSEGRTQSGYLCSKCGNYDGPGYDWIDWGGGECPVPTGTLVDVKWRDGRIDDGIPAKISHDLDPSKRNAISWRHHGNSHDIISYRLHQPQEAEQTEADDKADLNECIGQDAAPVWNGEGLPPVGEKVIFFINPRFDYTTQGMPAEGREIEVVAHKKTSDGNDVAVCYWDENGGGRAVCLVPESLMPAKSEDDRKREEAVKAITLTGWCQAAAEEIYDLVAAGKVPGMKLGD